MLLRLPFLFIFPDQFLRICRRFREVLQKTSNECEIQNRRESFFLRRVKIREDAKICIFGSAGSYSTDLLCSNMSFWPRGLTLVHAQRTDPTYETSRR